MDRDDAANIGYALMEEIHRHQPDALYDYCPTELYVQAVSKVADLEQQVKDLGGMSYLAEAEQIRRPAEFLRGHPDRDMLQTVATCEDGTEITIVFLRGKQEHVAPLIREKRENERLRTIIRDHGRCESGYDGAPCDCALCREAKALACEEE